MLDLISLDKTNLKPKVKELYLSAFPDYERYPFWLLVYKSKKKNTDFYVIYDDSEYIGLLYLTYYKDIVYVFYLAIDPAHQSKGYGSKILQYLQQTYNDKRLFLNIEKVERSADNYEQRVKRKRFYEKNGFINTDFEIEGKDIVYEILYSGGEVYEDEYYAVFKSYLGSFLNLVL